MTRVLILGASGMLGSVVLDWMQRDPSLAIHATCREPRQSAQIRALYPAVTVQLCDVERDGPPELDGIDWVINAIGVIKPYIRDDNRAEVERALHVNSLMPVRLAERAERSGSRVIQIATDCVYSGRDGGYTETALHDATDVYGKSKSIGEVISPNVVHLRCSIIGPELNGHRSLLDWFLGQPRDARVNGYRNHAWNGVTTLHFARLCAGIIHESRQLTHVQHVVPGNDIAKSDLLLCFAQDFGRTDITITPVDAKDVVDRRLRTIDPATNSAMWRGAGYSTPPTVETMVAELAAYLFQR